MVAADVAGGAIVAVGVLLLLLVGRVAVDVEGGSTVALDPLLLLLDCVVSADVAGLPLIPLLLCLCRVCFDV